MQKIQTFCLFLLPLCRFAYEILPDSFLNQTRLCKINCKRNQSLSDRSMKIDGCVEGNFQICEAFLTIDFSSRVVSFGFDTADNLDENTTNSSLLRADLATKYVSYLRTNITAIRYRHLTMKFSEKNPFRLNIKYYCRTQIDDVSEICPRSTKTEEINSSLVFIISFETNYKKPSVFVELTNSLRFSSSFGSIPMKLSAPLKVIDSVVLKKHDETIKFHVEIRLIYPIYVENEKKLKEIQPIFYNRKISSKKLLECSNSSNDKEIVRCYGFCTAYLTVDELSKTCEENLSVDRLGINMTIGLAYPSNRQFTSDLSKLILVCNEPFCNSNRSISQAIDIANEFLTATSFAVRLTNWTKTFLLIFICSTR